MTAIAWTPPNGPMGKVRLPKMPTEPLTLSNYRGAMASRISRMIKRETPERAAELLEVTFDRENLRTDNNLPAAGEILAENSDLLSEMMPTFPVPVTEIQNSPEAHQAMREETLEEFLGILYRT
tara:strand:- start:141 stop:512 length:372 start_codon:yes stop_codon:yes gene_type:complete